VRFTSEEKKEGPLSGLNNIEHIRDTKGRSFSLYYNDLARWLFITLAFAGMLSAGWFGIPLAPRYLAYDQIDIVGELFTLFSALGAIWGIMAYKEFTKSVDTINSTRDAARIIDSGIGDYEHRSYNPKTREYEHGYVPLGPIDFWDKETHCPFWLDKGKYWNILLGLQVKNKEIILQVVRDKDLPFLWGKRNVAITFKELIPRTESGQKNRKRYRYRVKIPQWLVINSQRVSDVNDKATSMIDNVELNYLIADLNKKLVAAASEIIQHEKPRIQYPWRLTGVAVYLNKSLPLRIVYKQIIKHFPGARKHNIDYTNENLANVNDDDLINALLDIAIKKGIPTNKVDKTRLLLRFMSNSYTKQGLGEGSTRYHNFHHSLEVSYLSLQMLPKEFHEHKFSSRDYELLLVAGLLHDYDPEQTGTKSLAKSNYSMTHNSSALSYNKRIDDEEDSGVGEKMSLPVGPKVVSTINEITKNKIHDAYFTMTIAEFENYFRASKSSFLPPIEFSTTHPEYVMLTNEDERPVESIIIEAIIWHTDFPYSKQSLAQEKFSGMMEELKKRGEDEGKVKLLAEVLWLADLSVTYMGSDPIRAWQRVSNLYEELYLPKLEAVFRTDAFFSDFAQNDLFKQIIHMRHFPNIFRQRWNRVYQFFHEGNPSTHLNRTIAKARKLYHKVNLEIEMGKEDVLEQIAANNSTEYFIGIGKDQLAVLNAKSKFADLDPPNAVCFWGDTHKLLSNIIDNSIDNFLIVLSQASMIANIRESKEYLAPLLTLLRSKLSTNGSIQILTNLNNESEEYKKILTTALECGFQIQGHIVGKVYFSDYIQVNLKESGKQNTIIILTGS
jgi:hypothetical protein